MQAHGSGMSAPLRQAIRLLPYIRYRLRLVNRTIHLLWQVIVAHRCVVCLPGQTRLAKVDAMLLCCLLTGGSPSLNCVTGCVSQKAYLSLAFLLYSPTAPALALGRGPACRARAARPLAGESLVDSSSSSEPSAMLRARWLCKEGGEQQADGCIIPGLVEWCPL